MTTETNAQTNNISPNAANALNSAFADLAASKGLPSQQFSQPPPQQVGNLADGNQALAQNPPAQQPTSETPPAQAQTQPANQPARDYVGDLARKDRHLQEARNAAKAAETRATELESQYKTQLKALEDAKADIIRRMRTDPLALLREHGASFGDVAMASLAMEGQPQGQPGQKTQPAQLPAEVAEKLKELERLREWQAETEKFIKDQREAQQQFQAQNQRTHQVGLIKTHLSTDALKAQFPLIHDDDAFGEVLDRVQRHVGPNGSFADDREAEEVVEFYARQLEQERTAHYRQLFDRPGLKSLLGKGFGAQSVQQTPPKKPARQENEGEGQRNGAPAITNEHTQQRTTVGTSGPFDLEAARARAVAEMNALIAQGKTRAASGQ